MAKQILYKRVGLVQRKKSMTHEQFVNYWFTTHAELCKKLPGMRRYSVNLLEPGRFPQFPYDGFSELWFDSEEALNAALKSPEGVTLMADLPNFVEKIEGLVVEDHLML